MKYRNYEAAVEFDEEIGMFHGYVSNARDVITFYGRSMEELERRFKNSVEDYVEFCRKLDERVEH